MTYPRLYRKRIIPNECIPLDNDHIVSYADGKLITTWHAIRPKKDLHHGISCYFFEEGFKVSKFYQEDGTLLYWYCDIIDYEYISSDNSMIVTDLLADVIIYPDGFIKVVDIDEMVDALDQNNITLTQLKTSLRNLDHLLGLIYSSEFKHCQEYIEKFEAC